MSLLLEGVSRELAERLALCWEPIYRVLEMIPDALHEQLIGQVETAAGMAPGSMSRRRNTVVDLERDCGLPAGRCARLRRRAFHAHRARRALRGRYAYRAHRPNASHRSGRRRRAARRTGSRAGPDDPPPPPSNDERPASAALTSLSNSSPRYCHVRKVCHEV